MQIKKGFLVILISCISLFSCTEKEVTKIDTSSIDKELKYCFNYFMDTTNFSDGSSGYGLTQDRYTNKVRSSIAATGFLLASYPVFVKEEFLSKDEAEKYSLKTIETLLNVQNDRESSYAGCISHYLDRSNGKRIKGSEISTIDTAIAVSGALVAGGFFGGEVLEKANTLWGNFDLTKFKVTNGGRSYISMGVDDPTKASPKQLGQWDYYAEQLMIYILGAGNPIEEHRIPSTFYQTITKNVGAYKTHAFVYSWFGSLFTYQYSQAFFDFKSYNDNKGRNYFNNSVEASLAAYEFCVDNQNKYKTYSEVSWGLTACDTPLGYNGNLGTPPRGYSGDANYLKIAGTVAPTAAIGSMPYTPKESIGALENYLKDEILTDKKYGIRDSYNLDFNGSKWYDPDFIGIDKGIEVLQMANYKYDNFVSKLTSNNENVKRGFENNLFVYVGE